MTDIISEYVSLERPATQITGKFGEEGVEVVSSSQFFEVAPGCQCLHPFSILLTTGREARDNDKVQDRSRHNYNLLPSPPRDAQLRFLSHPNPFPQVLEKINCGVSDCSITP